MATQTYIKTIFSNAANVNKKLLSLEFYSHLEADFELYKVINPSFCTVTWTAGDYSKPDELKSLTFTKKLLENTTNMVLHVAGRNFKRDQAVTIVNKIKDKGIKNIMAIKGGSKPIEPDDSKNEFPYALELIRFLREEYGDYFNIATTGYPIGHPESADPVKDISYLKKKVDAGADFVICQGVFDLKTFKEFYKGCREEGIEVPILPAVYAINSYKVLQNLMSFCKIMPEDYVNTMERLQDNTDAITSYAVEYVSELIIQILKDEEIIIPGVHVFCFNNLELVGKIFDRIDFVDLGISVPSHCSAFCSARK